MSGLQVDRPPGSSVATLSWTPVPYATAYNIYRASSSNLAGLACFLPGVAGTSIPDDGLVPPPGQTFIYLVTSIACSGESGLGWSSDGIPRPHPSPCP